MKSTKEKLALGGLVVEIRSPASLPFLLEKRLIPFLTNALVPDITWKYRIIPADAQDSLPLIPLHELEGARINRQGDGSKLIGKPQVRACLKKACAHSSWVAIEIHHGAITLLDFKANRADIFFSREFAGELGNHGIGPAMLAPFLPHFEACLLHASAIVRNGRTAVFLAPDKGGKTTAVRLSPDGTILSDDQVLVRHFPNGFRVCGTPWGLIADGKLQAPLSALFLLEKSRDFSLTPLTARELVPHIWEEVKYQFAILPRPLKLKSFALVCAIAAAVKAWKMSFPENYIDWEAVDKKIAG